MNRSRSGGREDGHVLVQGGEAPVERGHPPVVHPGELGQVGVGHLPVADHTPQADGVAAQVVGPGLVTGVDGQRGEYLDRIGRARRCAAAGAAACPG